MSESKEIRDSEYGWWYNRMVGKANSLASYDERDLSLRNLHRPIHQSIIKFQRTQNKKKN